MPHSMTGFATAEAMVGAYKLAWEIRTVNHRYLDLGFRLPDEFRALEPKLRKAAADALKRGKVDCTLRISTVGSAQAESELDVEGLAKLKGLDASVREIWPEAGGLTVSEILRWPGVLKDETQARSRLGEPALQSFTEALAALCDAREREGNRLGEFLQDRLAAIEILMQSIRDQIEAAAPRYREKLLERLDRLDLDANPERLEQEIAFIAQRADVTEEADRLMAHISEVRNVLLQTEAIGRRLDFLIQELNREANTLASKVQDEELGRRAVDLKVLIEQMREQVQNIE